MTQTSESCFIFTSEAFYFLCICSLGLFRGNIINATCRGWWHWSCQPQSKDALEGHLWHPGQDNELSAPSPSQPSLGITTRKDKNPQTHSAPSHPYHTRRVPKSPNKPRPNLTSIPTVQTAGCSHGGSPDSSWVSQSPKLEPRVPLISLSSPEQGEGTVTGAQLFTPGREFLCQWFQYQTAELCLVCGWRAALLLFSEYLPNQGSNE